MNLTSDNFLENLKTQLKEELPGKEAHLIMAPKYRKDSYNQVPENARPSAVSIVLHRENSEWSLILIKRPAYEGTHSNQVSFPGGKLERDETFEDGARRETFEEIGLQQDSLNLIGELSPLYINVSNFLVHPFVFYSENTSELVKDEREVDEIFRVPIKDLIRDDLRKMTDLKVGGLTLKNIPYFDLHSEIVWGATACILSEFAEIIR